MHPSPPTYEDLNLEARVRLDEVIERFEIAFLAGPATRLEGFLGAAQEQNERAVLLLELLCVELECRRRLGQVPTVEEYLLRLPEDAETVWAAFRAPLDGLAGTRLGKYQLTRLIGRGGMGTVYAATDTVVNRQVAVKILSESLATDRRAHEYLLREAQLVGRLLHPNVVTLFEADEVDGVCYLVLEHVSGGSAATSLRHNGPFNWIVASRIILDVCQGLAAAHAVGLIHRDIKPANILLLEPESTSPTSSRNKLPLAKLTDFGLARASEDEARVGTPRYMAPEQFAHGISNVTTDIYSLGATYFTLLSGSAPFEARTLAELQEAHRAAPVPDVRRASSAIPEACARIVRRCLAKSPNERYQTVEQIIADLDSLLNSTEMTWPSRHRYLIALAGLTALGLVTGVMMVRPSMPTQAPGDRAVSASTRAGPWESLFNGRDFTGWQIRDDNGVERLDTAALFLVEAIDGEPTVWVSGRDGQFYLATVREYENYHLSLEFCWLPPVPALPNSGVIYHCCVGEQDVQGHEFDLRPPWSGRYSHFFGLKPLNSKPDNRDPVRTRVGVGVLHQGQLIPAGVEVADTPLTQNGESEPGKWNRLDLICVGDSALHVLNSKVVLALTRSRLVVGAEEKPLTRGRIMLQSCHGAVAFRRIRIRSVNGIPPEFLSAKGE
jgi:eukaryotic-like serine/threonine-protein kinase